MDKNKVTVTLAGQDFKVVGSSSYEEVKQLEEMVNMRISDVQSKYPTMSVTRCILLAMLNMADELKIAKNNYETLDRKISMLRSVSTPSRTESFRNETKKSAAEKSVKPTVGV